MSRGIKKERERRRKAEAAARRASAAKRVAPQRNAFGGDGAEIQHTDNGYNVQMIRDFLDHLLLEVRCQHEEDASSLQRIKSGMYHKELKSFCSDTSPAVLEEFEKFYLRYQTALITATAFDVENATDAEKKVVIERGLEKNVARREEQIRHLEALQELFDEALNCAKMPFRIDEQGKPVLPFMVHDVRKIVDKVIAASLPSYDELLPQFEGHSLTMPLVIDHLKSQRVIVAVNKNIEGSLLLFRLDYYLLVTELHGDEFELVATVEVRNYAELQFLVATTNKFVGLPSSDGSEWKGLLPS